MGSGLPPAVPGAPHQPGPTERGAGEVLGSVHGGDAPACGSCLPGLILPPGVGAELGSCGVGDGAGWAVAYSPLCSLGHGPRAWPVPSTTSVPLLPHGGVVPEASLRETVPDHPRGWPGAPLPVLVRAVAVSILPDHAPSQLDSQGAAETRQGLAQGHGQGEGCGWSCSPRAGASSAWRLGWGWAPADAGEEPWVPGARSHVPGL